MLVPIGMLVFAIIMLSISFWMRQPTVEGPLWKFIIGMILFVGGALLASITIVGICLRLLVHELSPPDALRARSTKPGYTISVCIKTDTPTDEVALRYSVSGITTMPSPLQLTLFDNGELCGVIDGLGEGEVYDIWLTHNGKPFNELRFYYVPAIQPQIQERRARAPSQLVKPIPESAEQVYHFQVVSTNPSNFVIRQMIGSVTDVSLPLLPAK